MQNDSKLEKLFLKTLLNDQVLASILRDCLFHDRYERPKRNRYQIKEKEIVDLKFFSNESTNHEQTYGQRKKDDESTYIDSKMVRKILNVRLKSKVIYPHQALFVQVIDLIEKQRISIGAAIVFDQGLEDDLQEDLLHMQVALQMLKQFYQNQTKPIDRFYALILVDNLPFGHSKLNQACTLGWIDEQFNKEEEDGDKTVIRMVISYLNERNRNWDYIQLLELLWDETKEPNQKVKILQEELHMEISKSDMDVLNALKMRE